MPYVSNGAPLIVRVGDHERRVYLQGGDAEEYATLFARLISRGHALATQSQSFRDRFWQDFLKSLPRGVASRIRGLDDCDFSEIAVETARVNPAPAPAPAPAAAAVVDGKVTELARRGVIEGASLFNPRDPEHPLSGRIKRRVVPSDVIINIGRGERVPRPVHVDGSPVAGHSQWARVVHDPDADWIAAWRDPLTKDMKYVMLSSDAPSEQSSNRDKFELARRVFRQLPRLRRECDSGLVEKDRERMQLALCFWLLDRTAMRVGSRTTSATFGLTTLRVRHVSLSKDGTKIELDFPAKDGVYYRRTLPLTRSAAVAMRSCMRGKGPDDDLFERVNASSFNEYLESRMPGLTAKVMRTCLASAEFESTVVNLERRCLSRSSSQLNPKLNRPSVEQSVRFLLAVGAVRASLLCNHRVSTGDRCRSHSVMGVAFARTSREAMPLGQGHSAEYTQRSLDQVTRRFLISNSNTNSNTNSKSKSKSTSTSKSKSKSTSADVVRIAKEACLSTTTTLANYIDPRIGAALCVRHGMRWDASLSSKTLRARFAWAEADLRRGGFRFG